MIFIPEWEFWNLFLRHHPDPGLRLAAWDSTHQHVMFICFDSRRIVLAQPGNPPMIRSYNGMTPQIPDTCYVDDSDQLIGDAGAVILGGVDVIDAERHRAAQDGDGRCAVARRT